MLLQDTPTDRGWFFLPCTLDSTPEEGTRPRLADLELRLEVGDDLYDCHPLRWVHLPTSLNRLPQAVREFSMIRAAWSTSLPHRENPRYLWLIWEWQSPRKYLVIVTP